MEAFLELGFIKAIGKGLRIYRDAVSDYLSSEDNQIPAIAAALRLYSLPGEISVLIGESGPCILPGRSRLVSSGRLRKNSDLHLYYITPRWRGRMTPSLYLRKTISISRAIPLADIYNPLKSILAKSSPGSCASEEPALAGMWWASRRREPGVGVGASLIVED
jgi:hypothetical protein